jgi:hypothetical protein
MAETAEGAEEATESGVEGSTGGESGRLASGSTGLGEGGTGEAGAGGRGTSLGTGVFGGLVGITGVEDGTWRMTDTEVGVGSVLGVSLTEGLSPLSRCCSESVAG